MKKTLIFSLLALSVTCTSFAESNALDAYSNSYKICMDKAISTIDIIECTNTENSVQDKRLNVAYKKLISRQNAARVKQLTEVQKLWIKYRDANCGFYYDPDGGSMARILANDCMLQMTKDRAIELESLMTP
jgi:uncharacterized protein YecT (DUF1311 family)